jgi:hypothetical protein
MQQALEAVSKVSADRQDLLAVELIERLRVLERPPVKLSPEEQVELVMALAAAQRGEFAGDAEVEAIYAKHGL